MTCSLVFYILVKRLIVTYLVFIIHALSITCICMVVVKKLTRSRRGPIFADMQGFEADLLVAEYLKSWDLAMYNEKFKGMLIFIYFMCFC